MAFADIFQYLVEVQQYGGAPLFPSVEARECASNCSYFWDNQPGCPGSSFTAIGAAFATQGYFAQADLLWQLTNTNLGLWAPLLYIMAALGGLIGVAMGMPPKMYLWFFMGPAIYSFLLGTTVPSYGTSWCIANIAQDQQEVWKLAEVGLRNSNIVALARAGAYQTENLNGPIQIFQYQEPSNPVDVSYLFLWFDSIVSSSVQWMTVWTGIYQQVGGDNDESGILTAPTGSDTITADQYYLMSNLKWPMLDRITSARLHNGDVRDALVTFLSSECGDQLAKAIEPGNMIAASNSKTGQLPESIFRKDTSSPTASTPSSGGTCQTTPPTPDYSNVTTLLQQSIPIPRSVRRAWWNPARTSTSMSAEASPADLKGTLPGFYQNYKFTIPGYTPPLIPMFFWGRPVFVPNTSGISFPGSTLDGSKHFDRYLSDEDNMMCSDLLLYVLNGMRWEAGQIYYQLISTAPRNMESDQVIFNLFYGWDLRDQCGNKLNTEGLQHFLKDLILIHLIRNEMAVAPKVVDSRFSGQSAAAANPGNRMIAETGAKAKFGEVYTWALMMPYVQGVLMYLLAMAYPFMCVMIVVPGWHKTLFTWMSFWTWVKLWDLGFAVVLVLERSIWAVMGNNSTAQALSGRIAEMQQFGKVYVDSCSRTVNGECPTVPRVYDMQFESLDKTWTALLSILDRSMMIGSSIDFDVQNGYYIYIMSALYFAVPAVTGQLVLGAKAGAASMATNLVQGAQDASGRAAQSSFTGGLKQAAAANGATQKQEASAKAYRNQGIAQQALEAGNNAAMASLAAGVADQTAAGMRNFNAINDLNSRNAQANLGMGMQMAKQYTSANGLLGMGALAAAGFSQDKAERGPSSHVPAGGGGIPGGGIPGNGGGGLPGGGIPGGGGGIPGGGLPGGGVPGSANPQTGGRMAGEAIGALAVGSMIPGLNKAVTPEARQAMLDYMNQAGQNFLTRGFNQNSGRLTAYGADAGISGFGANMNKTAFDGQNQRIGAQANFGAEMAAWQETRDFANQAAPYLSALGVENPIGPGSKPTDMMGMAMSGMLGSTAKSTAGFFNNGGAFMGMASREQGALQAQYGSGAIAGAYQSGTPGQELDNAWGGAYQTLPSKDAINGIITNPGSIGSVPFQGNWNPPAR